MLCYQTLAATIAVANAIEKFPSSSPKLPLSVIANWMGENNIEAEDVLFASTDAIATRIENLVRQNQPSISRAA